MNVRLLTNLATFALVAVLAVVWAATSLFGGRAEPVARAVVELEATAGLRAASDVTYLGQPVGRVEEVTLHPGRVEAAIRLDRDDLPAAVTAAVRRRSAVGEPYLDLAPRPDAPRPPAGPALTDGARIAVEDTSLPRSYSELFASVAELFGAVDADDLGVVLGEITAALDGRASTVQRVLRDGAALAATLADRTDTLEAALDEVGALTGTLADESATIAATFDDLADVGATLTQLGDDYRTLVGQEDAFLGRTVDLLEVARGDLACTVTSLADVADALDAATLREVESVLDATPRVRDIVDRVRDDRAGGRTFVTVNTVLSDRPVGGQQPRRDRDPQPPGLGSCGAPAPLTGTTGTAALALDDRQATGTDERDGLAPVEREQIDEVDELVTSTERDVREPRFPLGPILLALAVVAAVGALRPWRVLGRG